MLLALFWPWVSVYFSLLTSYAKIKHYTKEIYKSKSRNSINIDVHTVENGKINNIIPHKISIMLCTFPRDVYPELEMYFYIVSPQPKLCGHNTFEYQFRSHTHKKKKTHKTIHYIYSVLSGRFISIPMQPFMTTTDQLSQTDTFCYF